MHIRDTNQACDESAVCAQYHGAMHMYMLQAEHRMDAETRFQLDDNSVGT